MQRCGVSPLCVPTVDVVSSAEFLHSSQTAFLGGIQQGGVTPQEVLNICVTVFHQIQRCVTVPVLPGWVSAMLETGNNQELETGSLDLVTS